jgi:hypothetical protein
VENGQVALGSGQFEEIKGGVLVAEAGVSLILRGPAAIRVSKLILKKPSLVRF